MLITTRMVQLLGGVQLDRTLVKLPVANKEEFKHGGSVFLRRSRQASDRGNTMTLVSSQILYVSDEIDCLILSTRAMKDLRMVCHVFPETVCQVDTDNKAPQSSTWPSESSPTHPSSVPAPPSPNTNIRQVNDDEGKPKAVVDVKHTFCSCSVGSLFGGWNRVRTSSSFSILKMPMTLVFVIPGQRPPTFTIVLTTFLNPRLSISFGLRLMIKYFPT